MSGVGRRGGGAGGVYSRQHLAASVPSIQFGVSKDYGEQEHSIPREAKQAPTQPRRLRAAPCLPPRRPHQKKSRARKAREKTNSRGGPNFSRPTEIMLFFFVPPARLLCGIPAGFISFRLRPAGVRRVWPRTPPPCHHSGSVQRRSGVHMARDTTTRR